MAPPPPRGVCGFCRLREQTPDTGLLFKTDDDQVAAHFNCMLFSPTLVTQCSPDADTFGGFLLEDVKKEIRRGCRLKCYLCKHTGATIGCDISKCKKSYHYLCAKKSAAEIIEDEAKGVYKIYCARHKRESTSSDNQDDDKKDELSDDDDHTIDDISYNSDDDFTCEEDDDNDSSLKSNKKKLSFVLHTAPRNILNRSKTSTPQGKETHDAGHQLHEGINEAIPGPSDVPRTPLQTQKDGPGGTPGSKRKRRIYDSESSGSSVSILSQSSKRKQTTPVGNDTKQSTAQTQRNLTTVFSNIPIPQSMERQITEGSHEEHRNVSHTGEYHAPKWIEFLAEYYARIKQRCDDDGQAHTMNATDFWQLCREKNCMEVLFEKMKTSLESCMQHIQSQNASEEDNEQVFKVLMATGCLKTVAEDTQQEIRNRKEALERERENLVQNEKLLADILPTLNKPNTSECLEYTAESTTRGSPG